MDAIKEKWELIKQTLREEYDLSDISYSTWVEPLKYGDTTDNVVTILIPSDQSHALQYINMKYKSYFQVTISEMFNNTYEISFILEKDNVKKDTEASSTIHNHYNINYENANLNPKYTFETFVVGSNNTMAHSASLAVAESPGKFYNPLFLYGGAGLGKTHLMHSIGHFILKQDPNKKILYVTSEQFTNEVIESIRSGNSASINKLREKYRTVDVLMIDDIQFIIGKESTQEEFFHTFNTLREAEKHIVISSDKPPQKMETLEERFRSRFGSGLVVDIQPPDYETRMAILRKNAEAENRVIDDQVLDYIASNIKSNIRELEGAFNKIIAYSKLKKIDINLAFAEDALKDVIYPNKPTEITADLIIDVVAEQFNVRREDIISKRRNAEFVLPRQTVMYIMRNYTNKSQVSIAKILGKKDHTTIINGVEKIEKLLSTDKDLQNKIDMIIKKINPS